MGSRSRLLSLVLAVLGLHVLVAQPASFCEPNYKLQSNGSCAFITDEDVVRGTHDLAHPVTTTCSKVTESQDIEVCEDNLPKDCVVWSIIVSLQCNHYGSLQFEKYWASRGCKVTVFLYSAGISGVYCPLAAGPVKDHPNLHVIREDIRGKRCFSCFYSIVDQHLSAVGQVDVLKLQSREGVKEDLDGVQLTILSDLFIHKNIQKKVRQIVWELPINSNTLTDTVARESAHAWDMWAASQFLSSYRAFRNKGVRGPSILQPVQYSHFLDQAEVPTQYSYYRQSYLLSPEPVVRPPWTPIPAAPLHAVPPAYCKVPPEQDATMQAWIDYEIKLRCHPTRMWVPCEHRPYSPLIPCLQELLRDLAEDYAVSRNWCDFDHPAARIPHLQVVDKAAEKAFSQPALPSHSVRIAFFFTVYTDASHVIRLVSRLYSAQHYYLLHIDAASNDVEFEEQLRAFASERPNLHISRDMRIVYGASTATILLTRAMAWFARKAKNWDYFVPVTGSDYPLIPLHRFEKMLVFQQPPMPFVMAWSPGTSTHLFRLQKTHPIFEENPYLAKSFKAVTAERGAVLGAVPMEFRSNNFGPPLLCNGGASFYHLNNRMNKSMAHPGWHDTQWLFPRDIYRGRGRAVANEDRDRASPSFDGVWRVWKKSDPATTGAYDRATIDYIVDSTEGRKYFHFFKHMLLGSEEHYYVSLLYNYDRTRAFVQTLNSQIVWNTWELGMWEPTTGFHTHTHFLTMNEWDILVGFSLRGMVFARKFSKAKTGALLDRIDQAFHFNESTEAGLYWPGFYEVDTTSPGKQWVANYRKSLAARRKKLRRQPMGRVVGNFSHGFASTDADS